MQQVRSTSLHILSGDSKDYRTTKCHSLLHTYVRSRSSNSALPILLVLARPQDLGGSKLTLPSCKNQTLSLVTNLQCLETRWHKVSLLSAHALYVLSFSYQNEQNYLKEFLFMLKFFSNKNCSTSTKYRGKLCTHEVNIWGTASPQTCARARFSISANMDIINLHMWTEDTLS